MVLEKVRKMSVYYLDIYYGMEWLDAAYFHRTTHESNTGSQLALSVVG
jgi:hypothetical protein